MVTFMSDVILEYEGLVYSLSNKCYGAEKEDLIQAGFLGLTKALKNYNPESGTKFSTYAYEYIYGEMYETANGTKPIRIRKEQMRLYKSVIKTRELLTQKYGRDVSYEETAAFLNIDYGLLTDILNSLSASISIENTELNLSRRDNIDDMILLKESLEQLSSLEKSVIEKRYMNDLSQDETAKTLGLSQVKVSRIEKKSKEKMREFIRN